VVLAGARAGSAENAVVAPSLVSSTIQSARQFAVARAMKAGMVSASSAALAERFLRSMLMIRIKNTAMAALIAIGIATAGALAFEPPREKPGPASNVKQEILDLMHDWAKAVVQSDPGTMDRLLAYELIATDPIGALWDKAKYLEHVKTNAFHVESTEFKDTSIDVYGDAAVVTGLEFSKINSKRPPYVVERGYIVERVTTTWIRRRGTWQCVAFQTMVIEAGEHEPDAEIPASSPASKIDRDSVSKGDQELTPISPHQ
jgi:hypothetical protein